MKTTTNIPLIYEGPIEKAIPKGFNALNIKLPAHLEDNLNWKKQKKLSSTKSKEGYRFLWELQLGLFHDLPLSLSDTSQYHSLHLALDHFFDTLWQDFSEQTIGASLYRGSIDMTEQWPWDIDQTINLRNWLIDHFIDAQSFTNQTGITCSNLLTLEPKKLYENDLGKNLLRFYCLGVAIDYFDILCARFPTALEPYIFFDTLKLKSPVHLFQLLEHEDLEFINIGLKGNLISQKSILGWGDSATSLGYLGKDFKEYISRPNLDRWGMVIPSKMLFDPTELKTYDKTLMQLQQKEPTKLISEKKLTIDWQGLDNLFVLDLGEISKRKLEGFIAAGGNVIHINQPLGLSKECSLQSFLKSKET